MASYAEVLVKYLADTSKVTGATSTITGTGPKLKGWAKGVGAAIGTAFAVGAVVKFGKASVDAAAGDAKAQANLATTLENTTGATKDQIAASETYIGNLSKSAAVADDELRPAMATLARGFGDTEKAQDALALATDISAGTGKDLSTVTDAMAKAARGNTGALGRLGIKTKDAAGEALTLEEVMADAAKTFDGQAAVAAETTAGKMEGAQIAMGELSEQVGTALLPVVGQLADTLTNDLMPILSTIFAFIAENTSWLIPLAAGIMAVVVATKIWKAAQLALNITMKASTIGLIIAAIGLLVAAGVWLVANWDKIVAWLKKIWKTIQKVATTVWNAITNAIETAWNAIKDAVSSAINWVKDKISTVFKAVKKTVETIWNGIKAFFKGYWDVLKTIFGTPIEWIKDKVGDVFKGIKETIKTVWNAVKTYFSGLWEDIQAIFQGAWDWFVTFVDFFEGIGDTIGEVWDTVTEGLASAWEGLMSGLKSAVNFFIRGINSIIGGINGVIDKVNSINPFKDIPHIPTIPELARGGVLTKATLFVGGEAGTEIVTPEKLLRSIIRQEGGTGGGGDTFIMNVYPRRADAQDVAYGFRRLELAKDRPMSAWDPSRL